MLPDDCREIFGAVDGSGAFLKQLHNGGRVNLRAAGGAPGYDILQLGFSDPQTVKLGLQLRDRKAGQDGLYAVGNLRIDLSQLRALCAQIRRSAIHLVCYVLRRFCEVQAAQVRFQVLYSESLYLVCVDILRLAFVGTVFVPAAVIPGLIPFPARACVPDIGGTAGFALDQPGKQIGSLGLISGIAVFISLHSVLHLLPCFLIDDRRDRILYPYHIRIQTAAGPFSQELTFLFIPCVCPDISFVLQKVIQAVFPDGPATLAGDTLKVINNVVVAFPVGIPSEYFFDNRGLCRVNDISAFYGIIAKRRNTAEENALFCLDGHTVHGFLPGSQNLRLTHANSEQLHEKIVAVGQVSKALAGGTDYRYAHVHHGFPESEPVAHITASSADIVNDNGIDFPGLCRGDHGLKTGAVCVCSGAAFVGIGGCDLYVVFRTVFFDFLQLVRDAVFCLLVRTETGISCCFHKLFPCLSGANLLL